MVTHRSIGFRTVTGAALIAAGLGAPLQAQQGAAQPFSIAAFPGAAAPQAQAPAQAPVQAPVQAPAQAPALPAGPLTLEQVLAIAEGRSETIAGAQAGIRRAEGDEIRARAGMFPQLSASLGYDRSLASEFEGVFDDLDFGGGDGSAPPADDGGLEDLPFGRANTWRATLQFSQQVFSGGRIGAARDLAAAGRDVAGLTLTTARAQLLFDVTQAYYDAALSERLVAIAEASLAQAGATLQQTQAGFDAGTQPEFEVLRARVSRDNQTPLVIRQRVNRDVALLRLKQLLDVPAEQDLPLAPVLSDAVLGDAVQAGGVQGAAAPIAAGQVQGQSPADLPPPPVFAAQLAGVESAMRTADWEAFTRSAAAALPERAAVTEAATAVRVREAALRLAAAQKNPSVEVNSTYSRIAYPSDFLPTFDRTNWTVGAFVNLPILTGGRQRGDEMVARAELEQAQIQRRQVEELTSLDTRSAWAELLAAKATWEASSGTVQQAARAFQIANVRYGAGVSTQLELTDSRLLLQQAEANRAQAARDLQVARARVALLPNLPLAAGAGSAPRAPQPAPQLPAAPAQPGGGQFRNASNQGAQAQTGTR